MCHCIDMSEFTQTLTKESAQEPIEIIASGGLPSAHADLTTSNLERIRVIEDELLALARACSDAPEVAEIIEQIEQLKADARAEK